MLDKETFIAITSERQKTYGDAKENHNLIADTWIPLLQPHAENIRLGKRIPAWTVALMMASLKLVRMRHAFLQDNYDDAAIYMGFAEKWQKEDNPPQFKRGKQRVYVAGPYTAPTPEGIEKNRQVAIAAGLEIMKRGHLAHVPHFTPPSWENHLDYETFMEHGFTFIRNWATCLYVIAPSPGTLREIELARSLGLKVYTSVEEIS